MILFTILLAAFLIIALAVSVIAIGLGAGMFVIFGDLFVCIGIIWLIAKIFKRKKR